MNLDEAVQKHAEWKMKFRGAISKKEQPLPPALRPRVPRYGKVSPWMTASKSMAWPLPRKV